MNNKASGSSRGNQVIIDDKGPKVEEYVYTPYLADYNLPTHDVNLEDLRRDLRDRLLVLMSVGAINRRTSLSREQKRLKMIEILKKYKLPQYLWLLTNNGVPPSTEEEKKFKENEIITHLLMNAVFYPWTFITEFLRKQEITFFEWQIMSYETPQVMEFLDRNKITFPEATQDEKETLQDVLKVFHKSETPFNPSDTIYKIPFQFGLTRSQTRDILVHRGICYIPKEKMKIVLRRLYLYHLQHEAKMKYYEFLDKRILNHGRAAYLRYSLHAIYHKKFRKLRPMTFEMSEIDSLISLFPPCFRKIYDELLKTHHLKHFSRTQFYRLLHGIGAKVEEVEMLMRKHFVNKGRLNEHSFQAYSYYLYHSFGLKGSRIHYGTPDCCYNINSEKRLGEVNGCPFGSRDEEDIEDLGNHLSKWNIPIEAQKEIKEFTAAGECSKACAAHFQAVHGTEPAREILNPLDYYLESQDAFKLTPKDPDDEIEDETLFDKIFLDPADEEAGIFDLATRKRISDQVDVEYEDGPEWIWNFDAELEIDEVEGFEDVFCWTGGRYHDFLSDVEVKPKWEIPEEVSRDVKEEKEIEMVDLTNDDFEDSWESMDLSSEDEEDSV